MTSRLSWAAATALGLVLAGCSDADDADIAVTTPPAPAEETVDADALQEELLSAYVAAINSNDTDTMMARMDEDVIFHPPHTAALEGRAALRRWVEESFAAGEFQYEKDTERFHIAGDHAIETYTYTGRFTPAGGDFTDVDEGKGIVVYRRNTDGDWLIVQDTWNSDHSLEEINEAMDARTRAVVEGIYDAFSVGDIERVTMAMADDIEWREAESNVYAESGPFTGPDAVVEGLFMRLGGEWDGFSVAPDTYVVDGDTVVVTGRYGGTYKATGREQDIPFVHHWTLEDGEVVAFQQYTDTAALAGVMRED